MHASVELILNTSLKTRSRWSSCVRFLPFQPLKASDPRASEGLPRSRRVLLRQESDMEEILNNSYTWDMALTQPQDSQHPFASLTFFRILVLLTFQYSKHKNEASHASSLLELCHKCILKDFWYVYQQAKANVISQILRLYCITALEVSSESSQADSVLFSTPRRRPLHSGRRCTLGACGPSFLTCCKFQGDSFVECQGPHQAEAE